MLSAALLSRELFFWKHILPKIETNAQDTQHVQHRWITFQMDEMSELSQNYNKTPPPSCSLLFNSIDLKI